MRSLIFTIVMLIWSFSLSSQTFEMKTDNFMQLDETTIQWELWIKKSSGEDFGLYTWQVQWTWDNGILNGGEFADSNFTISPGADAVFMAHYNNADAIVPGPGQYFSYTPSSYPDTGEYMTLVTEEFKHIATFTARLSQSGNLHNFGSADPQFAHRLGGILEVFAADNPYQGPGTQSQITGTLTTAPGVPVNDRQLAGYWFYGTNDFNVASNWNQVLKTATPAYTQVVPTATDNAVIAGSSTVTDFRQINQLTVAEGGNIVISEDGELTVDTLYDDNQLSLSKNQKRSVLLARWGFDAPLGDPQAIPVEAEESNPANTGANPAIFHANTQYRGRDSGPYSAEITNPTQGNYFYISVNTVDYKDIGLLFEMYALDDSKANLDVVVEASFDNIDYISTGYSFSIVLNEYTSHQVSIEEDYYNQETVYFRWRITSVTDASRFSIRNIHVNGTLDVPSILIQSSPAGTGSLIHNNPGISATIERYTAPADWGVNGDGWHLISAPVLGQVIIGDWAPDGASNNDYDFYGWNEQTQTWLNQKVPDNNIFSFLPGIGYLVAYQESGTKSFIGPVAVADVESIPITNSGTPAVDNHYGWNLLGNPYASALLWGGGNWGNVATMAKIWSETSQGYVDIDQGDTIPSANGVFVYATQENGLISIPASSRVHSNKAWYKSGNERILLVAGDAQGLTAQQSVVRFIPEATEGFDHSFDAYFMTGYAPMFYSLSEGKRFSTNTLPQASGGLGIPFGFHKNTHDEFFIEMQETISDVIVNLTDLKLNITQNLSEQPVYNFTSASGDDANRFLLSFTSVGHEEVAANLLQAYSFGSILYVLNPQEKAIVELYNTQGQLMLSQEAVQGLNNISLSIPSGTYIVRMISAGETATRKVVIN
jgi:hypothetical protein